MKKILLLGACLVIGACQPAANQTANNAAAEMASVLLDKSEGCMAEGISEFGRYIGDWKIQDWQLQQDGTTWTEQKGARWNFRCVGDGIAVQDFWMPNTGGKGTNLRINDPEKKSWDIAWTATGAPGFMHIVADMNEAGEINMDILSPEQNPPRRIRFYPPTSAGWDWVMEMSFDGGTNWTAVYKIKATPWEESESG